VFSAVLDTCVLVPSRARREVEALSGTVDVVARVGDWTIKIA
jgi:hypothetical protein